MHRIRKHVPIYLQQYHPTRSGEAPYTAQGIHIMGDNETTVNGMVKRWCYGTPGKG